MLFEVDFFFILEHVVTCSLTTPLVVGKPLYNEVIKLDRMYEIHGLKPQKTYEVKVSYPATVSLQVELM